MMTTLSSLILSLTSCKPSDEIQDIPENEDRCTYTYQDMYPEQGYGFSIYSTTAEKGVIVEDPAIVTGTYSLMSASCDEYNECGLGLDVEDDVYIYYHEEILADQVGVATTFPCNEMSLVCESGRVYCEISGLDEGNLLFVGELVMNPDLQSYGSYLTDDADMNSWSAMQINPETNEVEVHSNQIQGELFLGSYEDAEEDRDKLAEVTMNRRL